MPADYTRPPGLADYKVLLQSINVYPTDAAQQSRADEQLVNIAAGVWREFERRVGKRPYLVQNVDATLRFPLVDHTGVLQLGTGLRTLTSLTINGVAQTVDSQFWLGPVNAAFDGDPYTEISFGYGAGGWNVQNPNPIVITGRWGWYESVPADVWLHVLRYGTALALGSVENLSNVANLSQDGFSKGWDVVGVLTQKDLEQIMQKRFDAICLQNVRVIC